MTRFMISVVVLFVDSMLLGCAIRATLLGAACTALPNLMREPAVNR